MALLIEPDLQRYGVSGPADNIPVDAPTGRTLLSGQADPRRQEPRPTLRPEDTLAGSQSHSEPDLGSAFDPTRTVAHAGTQDSTPGSHSPMTERQRRGERASGCPRRETCRAGMTRRLLEAQGR